MIWRDARVIVTGGAGFIGSHLVDRLIDEGARVTVIDDLSYGRESNVNPSAEFVLSSIKDTGELQGLVGGSDYIFHLAAAATTRESQMGWNDPLYDLEVNTATTVRLLEAWREAADDARFVFASSAAVYGTIQRTPIDERHPTQPVSPYGVAKLASENYCTAYREVLGLPATSVRIFNTYGPRQPRYVMYDFIQKLQSTPDRLEIIGDGSQVRDYLYVSDTVEAFVRAAQAPPATYNAASGSATTIAQVASMIVDRVSPGAEVVSTSPTWIGDIPVLTGDASLLAHQGFEPQVQLSDGIDRLVEYYE